jgi:hypothetical protein
MTKLTCLRIYPILPFGSFPAIMTSGLSSRSQIFNNAPVLFSPSLRSVNSLPPIQLVHSTHAMNEYIVNAF